MRWILRRGTAPDPTSAQHALIEQADCGLDEEAAALERGEHLETISKLLQEKMQMEQDSHQAFLEPVNTKQRMLKRLREAGL